MTRILKSLIAAAAVASTLASVNTASAYQRWLDVVNTSESAVYSVQMTNVADPDWGRDLLGSETILPGDALRVEPDFHGGYCRFDIMITYEDGYVEIFERVNLCELETLYA